MCQQGLASNVLHKARSAFFPLSSTGEVQPQTLCCINQVLFHFLVKKKWAGWEVGVVGVVWGVSESLRQCSFSHRFDTTKGKSRKWIGVLELETECSQTTSINLSPNTGLEKQANIKLEKRLHLTKKKKKN